MTTPDPPRYEAETQANAGTGAVLGWLLLGVLIVYTYLIHRGFGPEFGTNRSFFSPTSFVFSMAVVSELTSTIRSSLAWFGIPALLLAIAVFLTNRSAFARALTISCVLATLCFIFYGVEADQVWTFFHWRGSAVLTLMTCSIGFAIAAPFLAGSWLRLDWTGRLVTYLPFVALVLGFIRNATGTDQSLQFALSPWPAISVFGIGLGATFVLLMMIGLAFGVWGVAAFRSQRGSHGAPVAGVALGIAAPAGLLWLGESIGAFPFSVGVWTLGAMGVASVVAIVSGALIPSNDADGLRGRARRLAVGAALIAIPVVSGQALARYDYHVTREVLARQITDALAAYLEKEEIYPDELDELVTDEYLSEIPSPSIGFWFLYDDEFRYRSFGTSFILEFPAPGWVECAYTPPYDDEDDDGEEFGVGSYNNPLGEGQYVDSYFEHDAVDLAAASDDAGPADEEPVKDDSLDEAWSCPSAPPTLW